MVDLVFCTFPS